MESYFLPTMDENIYFIENGKMFLTMNINSG